MTAAVCPFPQGPGEGGEGSTQRCGDRTLSLSPLAVASGFTLPLWLGTCCKARPHCGGQQVSHRTVLRCPMVATPFPLWWAERKFSTANPHGRDSGGHGGMDATPHSPAHQERRRDRRIGKGPGSQRLASVPPPPPPPLLSSSVVPLFACPPPPSTGGDSGWLRLPTAHCAFLEKSLHFSGEMAVCPLMANPH